jgi:hypothetical protein
LYSQSLKSYFQYGNVLLQDHDSELAEISTNITKMKQNEKNYLELMDNNNDVIRFNVSKNKLFNLKKYKYNPSNCLLLKCFKLPF